MKKFIKSRIFSFLLGAIIFSAITAYAGTLMNSNEITFKPTDNRWNVTKVDEALNDLYSIMVPEEYTGSTEITPTYSDITLSTQDKLLKNNITISGIPSTYKNLNSTTTGTSADLATGKTLYNSDGSLITGTGSVGGSNCVFGTYNHSANTEWNIPIGFVPNMFFLNFGTSSFPQNYYTYDSSRYASVYSGWSNSSGSRGFVIVNTLTIGTNITSNFGTSNGNYKEVYDVNYVACR